VRLVFIVTVKQTIPHTIFDVARRNGSHIAMRGEDGTETTYAQLEQQARQCAAALIAHGVKPGDRVAIWAANSPRWIVAALGIHTAGATLVTLNTRLKGMEANYILAKSGARLLLTMSEFLGINYPAMIEKDRPATLEEIILMDGTKGGTPWDAFIADATKTTPAQVDERLANLTDKDISDILFTSGTTGHPKGVMTSHGQNIRVYKQYAGTIQLGPEDNSLIIIPFFHSFGYKAGWLSTLISGATLLPHAAFEAEAILKRIQNEKASFMPGPPTLYQSLLAGPYKDYDRSSLRIVTTGGASVPVALVEEMRKELGIKTVLTAYGLSESSGTVSMSEPGDDAETIARTAGRAIPGVEVRLVDEDGKDVAQGEAGELLVRGDCVMVGYFQDEAATKKAIDPDGWLHTGDVAVQDARGYITITDRKNDVVIVGGFNVYPAEVERILAANPLILQSAVIGVPDPRQGEVPKAFIVLRPGASATDADIIAWSRENMANYKVPRSVEIVPALPVNAAGKIQKFVLRGQGSSHS